MLMDTDSEGTAGDKKHPGCSLYIDSIEVEPSSTQLQEWDILASGQKTIMERVISLVDQGITNGTIIEEGNKAADAAEALLIRQRGAGVSDTHGLTELINKIRELN